MYLDIQVGWRGMHREEYIRALCRYGHDEGAVQECDEECLHEMTPARPVVMVTPAMLLNIGRSYNSKCPPGASRPQGTKGASHAIRGMAAMRLQAGTKPPRAHCIRKKSTHKGRVTQELQICIV